VNTAGFGEKVSSRSILFVTIAVVALVALMPLGVALAQEANPEMV